MLEKGFVGSRIKELRKERGLSLKELSYKIDISVSFLSDIENGKSNPSLERLADIASGLQTTVSFLLGEATDDSLDAGLQALLSDLDFRQVLEELSNFPSWSNEDKGEVLAYLKAKNLVRQVQGKR